MQQICLKEDWQQVQHILMSGKGVMLMVRGTSMLPLLRSQKDAVLLLPPARIVPGQIVLYRRADGDVVLHRVLGIHPDGFSIVGDHQLVEETNIQPEQILAVVTSIRRGRFTFSVEHPLYRLYSAIIQNRWARRLSCHYPGKV